MSTAASGVRPASRGRWARTRVPGDGQPLFVYGTLRFPEVLGELIGRTPDSEPATLAGTRPAALPGHNYPGLVTAPDTVTEGFLLGGLTADEWRILDAFEDDEYELRPVCVHAGDRELYAWTYVWTAPVLGETWSATRFATVELPGYQAKCAAWRRNLVLLSETV